MGTKARNSTPVSKASVGLIFAESAPLRINIHTDGSFVGMGPWFPAAAKQHTPHALFAANILSRTRYKVLWNSRNGLLSTRQILGG